LRNHLEIETGGSFSAWLANGEAAGVYDSGWAGVSIGRDCGGRRGVEALATGAVPVVEDFGGPLAYIVHPEGRVKGS